MRTMKPPKPKITPEEREARKRAKLLAAYEERIAELIPNPTIDLVPGLPLRAYYDEVCRIDFRCGMDIEADNDICLIRKRDRFAKVLGALSVVGLAYTTHPPRIPEWIDFFGGELIPAFILSATMKMVAEVSGEWNAEREFEARILTWVHLGEYRFRGSGNPPLPVPEVPLHEVAVPDLVAMFDKWDFRELVAGEMRADRDKAEEALGDLEWREGIWVKLREVIDDTGLKIELTRAADIAALAFSLADASHKPFTGENITIYTALATMELVISDLNARMRAGEKFVTYKRGRMSDREVWTDHVEHGWRIPKGYEHLLDYVQQPRTISPVEVAQVAGTPVEQTRQVADRSAPWWKRVLSFAG